jgi:mRNA interferase RelE/StbE
VSYEIRFKKSAAKELLGLSLELKKRIGEAVDLLILNPRPDGVVKLKGDNYLYRIRIGDYRVVYEIDDKQKTIMILRVRHRRDVYDN